MPLPRPLRRAIALLSGALFTVACATPPSIDAHRHRQTETVTITDTAVLPAAKVTIPAFATIVWRNEGNSPVEVEVDKAVCNECDTVMGFAPSDHGARSVLIPPQGVATLCFHDEGEFAFTTHGGTEQHGVVHVGGGR